VNERRKSNHGYLLNLAATEPWGDKDAALTIRSRRQKRGTEKEEGGNEEK